MMLRPVLPPWKWTPRGKVRQREWRITINNCDAGYVVGEHELEGWTLQTDSSLAVLSSDGSVIFVDKRKDRVGLSATTRYSCESVQEIMGRMLMGEPLSDAERMIARLVAGVAIATEMKQHATQRNPCAR